MSQVRKFCYYKGCTSKQVAGVTSDITFFQFPRDPERLKIWQKLSRCENSDDSMKYLCSKHFDERKYVSKNPRRLLLLGNAIPYEYVSDNDDNDDVIDEDDCQLEEEQIQVVTSQFPDEDYLIHGVDVSEFSESECNVVSESTINEVEYVQQEPPRPSKSYENKHKKPKWETTHQPPLRIVKAMTLQCERANSETPAKKVLVSEKLSQEKNKEQSSVEQHDHVVDNPNITTFIFKGEEYIQMPKRVYLQEKNELLDKMQYYKDIVTCIKSQISDVQ